MIAGFCALHARGFELTSSASSIHREPTVLGTQLSQVVSGVDLARIGRSVEAHGRRRQEHYAFR
jgi:hypothetical protein